ncbi:MAG: polysaccharide biosynthesis protein [Gemmatimonadaceae bacterium]|nr:polysaccharide biosynthesis protein [Gemmatimonadaceae bacterium]MDQ3242730.1 oligosaccharide flippase family protein [Gemmatimonadota bacterium]
MTAPVLQGTRGPFGNFLALGSSEIVARAAGFAATLILTRKLGVDAFGMLGFAIAVTTYFGVAVTVGIADIGAREVARDPAAARQLAVDATAVRLLIALAGAGAIVVLGLTVAGSPLQLHVVVLSALTLIPFALDTGWVFRGLSRNSVVGVALLVAQLSFLAGVMLLIQRPADVARVPLIQFGGELLAAAFLMAMLFGRRIPSASLAGGIRLFRQSGFITASRLLRSIIVTFDVLLLGLMASNRDLGLYTAAYRVCILVMTIAVATHVVFQPAISRAALGPASTLTDVLTRSISLTSAVVLPLVAGGIVLSAPLLSFFFGSDYAAGYQAFSILLLSIGLLSLHGTVHNVFVSLHRTRQETVIFAAGASVNIALNLVLIPRFGIVGAATATLAAEASILIASVISLYRLQIIPAPWGLIRPLIACVAMVALLMVLRERWSVMPLVVAGGLAYVLVLTVSGGFPRDLPDTIPEEAGSV